MSTQEIEEEELLLLKRGYALDAASRVVAALVLGDHIGPELSDTSVTYNVVTMAATLEAYLDGRLTVALNVADTAAMLADYRAGLRSPMGG